MVTAKERDMQFSRLPYLHVRVVRSCRMVLSWGKKHVSAPPVTYEVYTSKYIDTSEYRICFYVQVYH